MGVTDHDTMAAVEPATRAADTLGMTVVSGIEITSVYGGKDVHVLAYFLSPATPGLQDMLSSQRRQRVERAKNIADRLAKLGAPIDVDALVATASAPGGKALARPQIAQALMTAGHVGSIEEAFERFLSEESPAYVPHRGASPVDVVRLVVAGGGVAALAHPGYRPRDEIIPELVDAGMQAIEVFHSSHDAAAQAHYLSMARTHNLLVTGGSDYHGEGTRRSEFFGVTTLPREHYEALVAYASSRESRRTSVGQAPA
jgi:predicted metal-dependent phosphoesterase TrpH